MPMIWNAEADAKLFAAVIKTSEGIKFNYAEIATYMGPDCTPKAVTHRITNLKKIAATLDTNGVTPTPAPTTTPSTPSTPKTPKKRTKTGEDGKDGTPTPNKKARTPNKCKGRKGAAEETNGHAEGGEDDAENGEDAADEVA